MRKLLLFVLAAFAFAACEQAPIEELSVVRADAPETLTVSLEGDDTRIQLNKAQKTVWTKGDQVSVFYRSNANQLWKYTGATGSRTANLKRVDAGSATRSMDRVVVVYPYNEDYYINPSTFNVQASLPAVQHYLKDSYGLDGNIMISSAEYNDVTLKNVCGWLKLQLTGNGEVVKSIKFRGNNGEQVAGELYINSADATAILASDMGNIAEDEGENATGGAGANLSFDDVVLKEVTLDCGEGVELGAEVTTFYIALPPQTFERGFRVDILCDDDTKMVKSSSNTLTIERNHIQPMTEFTYVTNISPSNQIWYTSSDGNVVTPNNTNVFGASIVSNTYNNGKGVITFSGDVTTIGHGAFAWCDSLTGVTIPNSVTAIGNYAFEGCKSLRSVTIPDSVTTMGEGAFAWCDMLAGVTIGDSVTTIEYGTFFDCCSLTSVTIGDSVTTIGDWAFYDCSSLTNVTIGDSVTTIGESTFYNCISLKSVTIPDSVTTIGVYAFYDCESLKSVTIGDSVTTIEYGAFIYCLSLTGVTIPDSVTTIGDFAFYGCEGLISVTIGDGVTTIGESAFAWCDILASVTIGDSVTTIGDLAFVECNNMTEFKGKFAEDNGRILVVDGELIAFAPAGISEYTIPNSVTMIREYVFAGCQSLTSVIIPDSVTTIGDGAFDDCWHLTSVTIGNSVTTIGEYAFSGCYKLTSITIPDSVTTIGERAFAYCYSLTSVTIPDSVTTIGEGAFVGCNGLAEFKGKFAEDNGRILVVDGVLIAFAPAVLTEYTVPDSVNMIGDNTFYNCYMLTSVTIPDSVTAIGDYAFIECYSLTSVYCKATTPPSLGSEAFKHWVNDSYNNLGCKIYVPAKSVDTYKSANRWSDYASDIVGYDFENGKVVETLPNNEIWYTSSDGNVVTPCNTNAFGASIVSNTYNNGKGVITFSGDVTEIGGSAFLDCKSLTSITISDSVTKIGDWAFRNCDSLTSVTIPDSVTSIGNYTFAWCDSLTSVNIGDSVTTIGDWAFAYCDSLTRVTIGDSVTTIGDRAFYECDSLTSVNIPDSVTTIGNYAFSNCDSLTSVTIGDSVTTIGNYAFSNCDSLTSVTIPDSVTTIGEGAFYECDSLTSVTIGDGITTIGDGAFAGCNSLAEFNGKFAEDNGRILVVDGILKAFAPAGISAYTIPDSVTTIGDYAFAYCDSLTSVTIPDSVTTIGVDAFAGCNSLAEFNGKFAEDNGRILVVDGVLKAFAPTGISEYTIPDNVTAIEVGAFYLCNSLTSITIPDSVTTIGERAFYMCDSLTSVYCKATTPPALGSYVFYSNGSGRKIYVPAESVDAYKSAQYWSEYASDIVGYNF